MTTYPCPPQPHPGTQSMSVTATAAVSAAVIATVTATAAGVSVLAAGMAEWGPGDWSAFVGVLIVLGGAFTGGLLKILAAVKANHVTLRTEVRQDVQAGASTAARLASDAAADAVKDVKTEAAKMVPPEQLGDLAKLIAAEMRQTAPPADGMTPDGKPKIVT